MAYLFTSESVSEGHPDKVSDQISDAVLDAMLTQDPHSRVACETFVTTGLAVVGGEITTKGYVDIQEVVRETIRTIGYTKAEYRFDCDSCGVLNSLHSQSPDIAQGVNEGEGVDKEQGAGDQGMMFGYAVNETADYMPMSLDFSHKLVKILADIRKAGEKMTYLRPDAKAQVTIEYADDKKTVKRVDTVVVSTQHDPDVTQEQIHADVIEHAIKQVIPAELLDDKTVYHVNPTGMFEIGGPHGDAGLTGRKIIVDTYGGHGAHGGGAFSGKDSSKVDRSAAYATRHIAKNIVAAGLAERVLVQVAYAIGVSAPVSLNVETYGTAKVDMDDVAIAEKINSIFDMRPKAIVDRLGLKNPIFRPTAAYGHMGRSPYTETLEVAGEKKEVEFFTWEKLDYVDKIKEAFGL